MYNIDEILNNAEMLFIKYGATVVLHYMYVKREMMCADVGVGVVDACIAHYRSML